MNLIEEVVAENTSGSGGGGGGKVSNQRLTIPCHLNVEIAIFSILEATYGR